MSQTITAAQLEKIVRGHTMYIGAPHEHYDWPSMAEVINVYFDPVGETIKISRRKPAITDARLREVAVKLFGYTFEPEIKVAIAILRALCDEARK